MTLRNIFLYALCLGLSFGASPVEAMFGSLVPAATYYVNQVTGDDINNGTSDATPFLTIGKAQSVAVAGNVIALYGGPGPSPLIYHEQLTVPAVRVGIVGYGAVRPVIDASDAISAGAWTKTGGRTNVYQATVTTAQSNGWLRLWEDNVSLARATSLANLDATAARYYVSADPIGDATVTFTMYVHATGDGSPASNGKGYAYNKRDSGVFSLRNNTLVSNVVTRRNLGNVGSLKLADYSFVTSVRVEDGTIHNSVVGQGAYWRYVDLVDSYYGGGGKIALVLNNDTPDPSVDATFQNVAYTETIETTGAGFYGHVNSGGSFGHVTLINCSTTGAASSISGFSSTHTLVSGGTFDGTISMGSTQANVLRNLLSSKIYVMYDIALELDAVTVQGTFTDGAVYISAAAPSLYIHGSTFSNARLFDGSIYIGTSSVPSSFVMTGNTFPASVQTSHLFGPGAGNLPLGVSINGNTYHYVAATPTALYYRGSVYDISNLTQWNAWKALGFDLAGQRITP